jgi:hypothetical protein
VTASSERSAKIRKKLQHLRGHRFGGRAAKFRSFQEHQPVQQPSALDFGCVASVPDWIVADPDRQHMIGLAAAILQERDAIERELSGDRLAAIAALVGNDLFEQLCDLSLPEDIESGCSGRLPRPEDFAIIGAALRRAAMPAALRDGQPGDLDPAKARMLCDQAADLIHAGGSGQ